MGIPIVRAIGGFIAATQLLIQRCITTLSDQYLVDVDAVGVEAKKHQMDAAPCIVTFPLRLCCK
jgi:tRNA 2-selenouridine synthase SelU